MTEENNTEEKMMEERYSAMNGMQSYGGSFAQALGKAIEKADLKNLRKIYENWPDEWSHYTKKWKEYNKNDQ